MPAPAHTEFLSAHVARATTGPVWHAQSLDEILADISAAEAGERPIPDAHTIAELVAHVGVWAAESERRLSGAAGGPTEAENFPAVDTSTDESWRAAVQRMRDRHASLSSAITRMKNELLHETMPQRTHTFAMMLHGVVEHDAYHAGQIVLLKKLVRARE